jgi:hypothetical protein
VLLIGLRRPFSPQAERLSTGGTMKKPKPAVIADEPMGIVIAWGSVAPSAPRVRAYLWCDVDRAVGSQFADEGKGGI